MNGDKKRRGRNLKNNERKAGRMQGKERMWKRQMEKSGEEEKQLINEE